MVKFINGIRRYIITAIDTKSDFAFAYTYKSPSSQNTKDFFLKLENVAPFKIQRIQTDNGSEFEKYFREYIEKRKITHLHNYPRQPKMNCYIERFNRTIQEEFVDFNLNTLAYDLNKFNDKLINWLLWYNTKRSHHSLGLISPMKFIINSYNPEKCNMLWMSTFSLCFNIISIVYARMVKLVYTRDLKSLDSKIVPVQVRLRAHNKNTLTLSGCFCYVRLFYKIRTYFQNQSRSD